MGRPFLHCGLRAGVCGSRVRHVSGDYPMCTHSVRLGYAGVIPPSDDWSGGRAFIAVPIRLCLLSGSAGRCCCLELS